MNVMRLFQWLVGGKSNVCLTREASVDYTVEAKYRWHVQYHKLSLNDVKNQCGQVLMHYDSKGCIVCKTITHYSMVDITINNVEWEFEGSDCVFTLSVSYEYKRRKCVSELILGLRDMFNMKIDVPQYDEYRSLQIELIDTRVYVYLNASNKVISIHKDKPSYVKSHKGTILTVAARKQFVQSGFISCSNGCGELKTYAKIDIELDNGLIVTFDDDIEEVKL